MTKFNHHVSQLIFFGVIATLILAGFLPLVSFVAA